MKSLRKKKLFILRNFVLLCDNNQYKIKFCND